MPMTKKGLTCALYLMLVLCGGYASAQGRISTSIDAVDFDCSESFSGDSYDRCTVVLDVSATSTQYIEGSVDVWFDCFIDYKYKIRKRIGSLNLPKEKSETISDWLPLSGTSGWMTMTGSFKPGGFSFGDVVSVQLTDVSCDGYLP